MPRQKKKTIQNFEQVELPKKWNFKDSQNTGLIHISSFMY